jgi:hypothetical protein
MRPRRLACVLSLVALSVLLLAAVLPAPQGCEDPPPPLASSTSLGPSPSSSFPHPGATP